MARMRARSAIFVVVLALVGCSKAAPEVEPLDQVDAANREAVEGAAEPSEGGDGAASEGGGGDATWVAIDIEFESAPQELAAGEVAITLENNGAAQHNVTFPALSETPVVEADGGSSANGTIELPAGTHEYICSVPGHESLMKGEVTVQ